MNNIQCKHTFEWMDFPLVGFETVYWYWCSQCETLELRDYKNAVLVRSIPNNQEIIKENQKKQE